MDVQTVQTVPELDNDQDIGWIDQLTDLLGAVSRHIALLAAWIAMSGSLFMSEVLGWRPCLLCWYQRILMYPLAIVLAVGIIRRDRGIYWYVLPFSVLGIGVSLYHYLLIKTDWLPPPACATDVPCTVDYLDWFGVINIPFLALTAFLIITCMMLVWIGQQSSLVEADDDTLLPEDSSFTEAPSRFDSSTIAVIMIIVGVVLTFMVASTFV